MTTLKHQIEAFCLGMREFRSSVTCHFDDDDLMLVYDLGRAFAHKLTGDTAMTNKQKLERAVGNASQEADKLRAAVNAGITGHELETRVACFVLAAAQVRNRFEEMEDTTS